MMMFQTPQMEASNLAEQRTTSCKNHICTATIHAEPIRFKSQETFLPGIGMWIDVDENYYNNTPAECPVEGYDWCAVNKYALNLKDSYDIHLQTKFQEDLFGYKLYAIQYGNFFVGFFPGNVTINGSMATYNLTSDLKYEIQYLPSRVKDAVIIDRDGFFQNTPSASTFDVWYEVTPGFTFNVTNEIINGSASEFNTIQIIKEGVVLYEVSHVNILNGNYTIFSQSQLDLENWNNQTYFVTRVNATDLIAETNYPIYIDPQVDVTYNSAYDSYIRRMSKNAPFSVVNWVRFENPSRQILVTTKLTGLWNRTFRGDVEFNLSEIPANSTLLELYLNLTPAGLGNGNNNNVSLMETDWHGNYPNNAIGNSNFFEDMGNGFEYNNLEINSTMVSNRETQKINLTKNNLTKTAEIVEGFFSGGVFEQGGNIFAIGMRQVIEDHPISPPLTSFYSRSVTVEKYRPLLTVVYKEPDTDWQIAVVGGLIGTAGLLVFISRRLEDEHEALKWLLNLMGITMVMVASYTFIPLSEDGNVNGVVDVFYRGGVYTFLTITSFVVINKIVKSFNMLRKPIG
tara:strand:+ start:2061 stop:3767 length:1707 start_codon:yes stop_codon:yes gene_type:complete